MANNYFDFINQNSRTADDLTPASGAQVQLTFPPSYATTV